MQLKRGTQRGSCDFCFRRKIKCDRVVRVSQGHQSCSHCELRQVPCRLDDSDDARIQKRKRPHDFDFRESQDAAINSSPTTSQPPLLPSTQHGDNAAPTPASFIHSAASLPGPATGESHSNQSPPVNFEIWDQLLGISSDSTSFLDQIFIPDQYDSADWAHQMLMLNDPSQTLGANNAETGNEPRRDDGLETAPHSSSSEAQCIDQALFDNALHAYFDIAASSMPILFEDSFWEDYRSGRCSRALSSAVACRGVPFIPTDLDNWDLQQRLARQFQDAIFETHNSPNHGGSVRLDDLEALALMVGFEYDASYGQPLQSHLAKLFLGHDSLVMMTLQSEIQCHHVASSSERLMFSKANDRRTLLFWHVYGLDAFHTLNRKTSSRIRDDDAEIAEDLSLNKTEGYLDTMLSLAMVARKIAQSLCYGSTRRLGIKLKDLDGLYADLQNWRAGCPAHLQIRAGVKADPLSGASDPRTNLRRAALRCLELNCYLQIDDCVSKFGLREQSTLDGEIAALRIESETLRAAHGVVEIAQWAKQTMLQGNSGTSYSLIDAAPQMLRNICAGTCFWMCLRGQGPPRLHSPFLKHSADPKQRGDDDRGGSSDNRHVRNHLDAAQSLREAVAAASSHQDTAGRLAQLDGQIELLQSRLD
ncbi:hypothetical protein MRS44_018791 [Fusarium solani]|uniref:uncharacterized protein n=1 Tax=Fusarium solani TaxID=169388 RepID=UPI0032C49474|nr:hypothetical protein MRS44_018791 [Fusarium solani]